MPDEPTAEDLARAETDDPDEPDDALGATDTPRSIARGSWRQGHPARMASSAPVRSSMTHYLEETDPDLVSVRNPNGTTYVEDLLRSDDRRAGNADDPVEARSPAQDRGHTDPHDHGTEQVVMEQVSTECEICHRMFTYERPASRQTRRVKRWCPRCKKIRNSQLILQHKAQRKAKYA